MELEIIIKKNNLSWINLYKITNNQKKNTIIV